jgi:quinol monooxygenase YgiN
MSIVYIGQSQANPDAIADLRNFLTSLVAPALTASEGCGSYQLFQSQEDPTQFIGIEIWASIEAHRASIKNIPAESIGEFMKLVVSPPSGRYYDQVV